MTDSTRPTEADPYRPATSRTLVANTLRTTNDTSGNARGLVVVLEVGADSPWPTTVAVLEIDPRDPDQLLRESGYAAAVVLGSYTVTGGEYQRLRRHYRGRDDLDYRG